MEMGINWFYDLLVGASIRKTDLDNVAFVKYYSAYSCLYRLDCPSVVPHRLNTARKLKWQVIETLI